LERVAGGVSQHGNAAVQASQGKENKEEDE
jgi:hypothetical protein